MTAVVAHSILACSLSAMALTSVALAAEAPAWAFPSCNLTQAAAGENDRSVSVAGSAARFTVGEIANWSMVTDWFPSDHSALPPIVAAGHAPQKPACGYCHLPDGSGRPENAKLAGLPARYIMNQVEAFHTETRRAGDPDWLPSRFMRSSVLDLSKEEIAGAADYFSRQTARSFVRVEERRYVPAHSAACAIFVSVPGRKVALGDAIVEMPDDVNAFDARDPRTRYVAYVPKGSIERGRRLAQTGGNDRTRACAVCHGSDLRGAAGLPGPPLAGRFATYIFRQLYGFQTRTRGGEFAKQMQPIVDGLKLSEMIDLAAYTASLDP